MVVAAQAERCAFKISYEIHVAIPLLIFADTRMATRVGGARPTPGGLSLAVTVALGLLNASSGPNRVELLREPIPTVNFGGAGRACGVYGIVFR